MSCPLTRGLQTNRHNAVRNSTADFLREYCVGGEVELEPPIPAAWNGGLKRPDIRMRKVAGADHFFDIAITNPCCETYMAHADAATPGNTALLIETVKHGEYRGLANFHPFVLEATGYMGDAALRFTDEVRNLDRGRKPFYKSYFFAEMLAKIALANAEMCLLGRRIAERFIND